MFTSNREGKNQIYVVDPDGAEEHRITFDEYNYFKPKWSKNFD
jgi:TolB protein